MKGDVKDSFPPSTVGNSISHYGSSKNSAREWAKSTLAPFYV